MLMQDQQQEDPSIIAGSSSAEECEFVPSYFEEEKQAKTLIQVLLSPISGADGGEEGLTLLLTLDQAVEALEKILEKYQEQSHLLDPHLESLVDPIVSQIRDHIVAKSTTTKSIDLSRLFRILYVICKVRGYKTVVKLFTHEVSDLEPTFDYLLSIDEKDFKLWETRYVLLLWLSIMCMIPFDLSSVDSGMVLNNGTSDASSNVSYKPLVVRISDFCKKFLAYPGKEQEAAAVVLARLLTRKDTQELYLQEYLNWAIQDFQTSTDVFQLGGLLTSVCTIFKFGPREFLIKSSNLLDACISLYEQPFVSGNSLIRKQLMKMYQRLGLSFLKPKVAPWRYNRGHRSLIDNLKSSGSTSSSATSSDAQRPLSDEDDDSDVPEEIEPLVGILLNGLRDKDTIVRWSAAKGIGRITNRLPRDFAEEIINSVISLFEEDIIFSPNDREGGGVGEKTAADLSSVSDYSWHGACLCLAELARRGLLLPEKLNIVVPWIAKAIKFDVKRGSHSVGAHVRDAACYVCWSFARAYSPDVMRTHMITLAKSLIIITVFDREVNIRRAGSAAFQESVGRLGIFPHGIEVVTMADYIAVGNRTGSFLEIAYSIANFEEYTLELIDHLLNVSITHWDRTIRELASKSLRRLTPTAPRHVIDKVLNVLLEGTVSRDLSTRHGSLMALGETCLALSNLKPTHASLWDELTRSHYCKKILDSLHHSIISPDLLESFGSDLTRQAICHLIMCLSECNWLFTPSAAAAPHLSSVIQDWWQLVKSSLERKEEFVQTAAVSAVESLCKNDLLCALEGGKLVKEFLASCLMKIQPNSQKYARRGYALALSCIPMSDVSSSQVIEGLIKATKIEIDKTAMDAESRRNAVQSLSNIVSRINVATDDGTKIDTGLFTRILDAYIECLLDYSIDARGDVGSWVREAALKALSVALKAVDASSAKGFSVSPDLLDKIIGEMMRQGVEKIDRVRETAGQSMKAALSLSIANTPSMASAIKVFNNKSTPINWLNPADVFPAMVPLLHLPEFRTQLLTGIIVSVGGLTESLVRHSGATLVEFLLALPSVHVDDKLASTTVSLEAFFECLLGIMTSHSKVDRVSIPSLECFDVILGAGIFSKLLDEASENNRGNDWIKNVLVRLAKWIKQELLKSKDVRKLHLGINVYCSILNLMDCELTQGARVSCLSYVIFYLAHPYPKLRRESAEQLYLVMSTLSPDDSLIANIITDEQKEEIEEMLLTIDWDKSVEELKEPRSRIAELLNVTVGTGIRTG